MAEFEGGAPLAQAGVDAAEASAGVSLTVLWSVISVETSGAGFLADRRPKILFERHVFHGLTGGRFDRAAPDLSNRIPGGYGAGGANQYARLERAIALDRAAALQSASWGLGQILGENFSDTGFADVETMVAACVEGEDGQLLAMARFIKSKGWDANLRAGDWRGFAAHYNGPDYAANNYDGLLQHFHNLYASSGPPDLDVRAAQIWLTYKGYAPGTVDGRMGPATAAAIRAFQTAQGLTPTGAVDAALLTALAA